MNHGKIKLKFRVLTLGKNSNQFYLKKIVPIHFYYLPSYNLRKFFRYGLHHPDKIDKNYTPKWPFKMDPRTATLSKLINRQLLLLKLSVKTADKTYPRSSFGSRGDREQTVLKLIY